MMFKAFVKSRQTKEYTFIESDYPNKSTFIADLKGNGYMVNPDKVKPSIVFDYIMQNTNSEEWDWVNWELDKEGNIIKTDKFAERINKRITRIDKKYR